MACTQIFILITASFAFAYLIYQTTTLETTQIENQNGSSKNYIDDIGRIVLKFVINKLKQPVLPMVSAENLMTDWACCEKNNNGAFCTFRPKEECNTNNNLRVSPNECGETDWCKPGCCVSSSGICGENTAKANCNGQWFDQTSCYIQECRRGCCILGKNSKFINEKLCETKSNELGIAMDFRNDVKSEPACLYLTEGEVQGSCVLETSDGITTTKNCIYDTQSNCDKRKGSFYPNTFCSNEELNTTCTPHHHTGCLENSENKDEVYWYDSCNNREEIKEACSIFAGTRCGMYRPNIDTEPDFGDYVCRDLSCNVEIDGKIVNKKNGESWCEYEGCIGEGKDPVGSRHLRHICYFGEEKVEACDDFRNQLCVQTDNDIGDGKIFSEASCRVNQWRSCYEYNNEKEGMAEKCAKNPDCTIKGVHIDKFSFDVCVPNYPPGFQFWRTDDGSRSGEMECAFASQRCPVVYIKRLKGWVCEMNCDCEKGIFTQQMNDLCTSLGDCGGYINFNGDYTDDGYSSGAGRISGSQYESCAEYQPGQKPAEPGDFGYSQVLGLPGGDDEGLLADEEGFHGMLGLGMAAGQWYFRNRVVPPGGKIIPGAHLTPYSSLAAGSTLAAGSSLAAGTSLASGSSLAAGSSLAQGSTAYIPAGGLAPPGTIPISGGTIIPGTGGLTTGPTEVMVIDPKGAQFSSQIDIGSGGAQVNNFGPLKDPASVGDTGATIAEGGGATGTGGGVAGETGGTAGQQGAGTGFGKLPTWVDNAFAAAGAFLSVSNFMQVAFGMDEGASYAIGGVVGAYVWFHPELGIYGLVLTAIIMIMGLGKSKIKYVEFTCMPWQPPSGGLNCDLCNVNDPLGVQCSEYRCKSLGETCEFINPRTTDEKCIDNNPNDIGSPKIKPLYSNISEGYEYINVNNEGFEIKNVNGECVPEYTLLSFGIETDKHARCKIGDNLMDSYDEMQEFFGGSNSLLINHTMSLTIPSPSAFKNRYNLTDEEVEAIGDIRYYIKCESVNGNSNTIPFVIRTCVKPGPDLTAPRITKVVPEIGYVKYQETEKNATFYVNEPADCRYSGEAGKTFDEMTNSMSCLSDLEDYGLYGWPCFALLTGIDVNSSFYIRCKDQPWFAGTINETDRNPMTEDYVYNLQLSRTPLIVEDFRPENNKEIISGVEPVSVELKVKTSGGIGGMSNCKWEGNGYSDDFPEEYEQFHTYTFTTATRGNYNINFICEDKAGNIAENSTSFKIKIDSSGPKITRLFYSGGLKVITDENSECRYSFSNRIYWENATEMSGNELEHTADWQLKNYYIQCQDEYGNKGGKMQIKPYSLI